MAVINLGKAASRYGLEAVAKQFGGRPAGHAQLDKYKMDGNPCFFWAREFAAKGVLLEKGKDLECKRTATAVEAKDVQKMLELHAALEAKLNQEIPVESMFYLVDPENYAKNKNGVYVLENPKITLVENALLEYGGAGKADAATKTAVKASKEELEQLPDNQKRWNYINDGVWPLARGGDIYGYWRLVLGNVPSVSFRVLIETDAAKQ